MLAREEEKPVREHKNDPNHTHCAFGAHSFGLFTNLAVQHWLGILSERRSRVALGGLNRVDHCEKDLTRLVCLEKEVPSPL
jgi:hypothetical protein